MASTNHDGGPPAEPEGYPAGAAAGARNEQTDPSETRAEPPAPSDAAPAADPAPAGPVRRPACNILLFSDGTGNSSGKLLKTNVWRLYEVIDLGPANGGDAVQIAYYDNGVGTSSFRPLAALGGIFGFGLARNVRDIYRFLCRNYQGPARDADGVILRDPVTGAILAPGDRIYAFGFSRGAYTIRLLVWLIVSMGVIRYGDMLESELDMCVLDMWREFRRAFHTNNPISDLFVAIGRAFGRLVIRAKRFRRQQGYASIPPPPAGDQPSRNVRKSHSHLPWWGREWWDFWWHRRSHPPVPALADAPAGGAPASDRLADTKRETPDIEFVGVWDTVAAYGGPFVEITRGIDEFIWPLTMPDYKLSPKVKLARHALAIDDKRDSFHPLLWDEVHEAELVARGTADGGVVPYPNASDPARPLDRLRQVWFAGMHADVGGGYSDESLSYVSLCWMIEHAEIAQVRLLADLRKRIFDLCNPYGPIHDSRGGTGAFYRYQPRYIGAWIDDGAPWDAPGWHVPPASQIFRDPTIDHGHYRRRGQLLGPIALHSSVEERLQLATDGYAPINLPAAYQIDRGPGPLHPPATAIMPPAADLAELGDRIKLRRFWYFVSAALALLFFLRPFWSDIDLGWLEGTPDVRTNSQLIASTINLVLPAFAERWTNAWAADPWRTIGLLLLIGGAAGLGAGQEQAMTDVSRGIWKVRLPGTRQATQRVRATSRPLSQKLARVWWRSDRWQGFLAFWKWHIVPIVVGLAMVASIVVAASAVATQVVLVWKEIAGAQCPVRDPGRAPIPVPGGAGAVIPQVPLSDPCHDLGYTFEQGTAYRVTVAMDQTWRDGGVGATPEGWTAHRWLAASTVFFRRVTTAPLFAPILETRIDDLPWYRRVLGDGVFMRRPSFARIGNSNVWEARFTTDFVPVPNPRGRLFFFVNDAVYPVDWVGDRWVPDLRLFPLSGRYRNNHGTVTITIARETGARGTPAPAPKERVAPQRKADHVKNGASGAPGLPHSNKSGTPRGDESDPHHRARRARAQPEGHRRSAAARQADRGHRAVGIGQEQPGVRHDLCGGAASLRREPVGVRAPVPRDDAEARR